MISKIGNRCDSCGASLATTATECEYCGRQIEILIRGSRLCELLELYIDKEMYGEIDSVADEILKDHPTNAMAWMAKGVAALNIDCIENISKFASCLQTAAKFGSEESFTSGILGRLKNQAAKEFATLAYAQAVVFSKTPSRTTFDAIHSTAASAMGLDDKYTNSMKSLLEDIDDYAEQSFGMVYAEDGYERPRNFKQQGISLFRNRPTQTPHSSNALLSWGGALALIGVLVLSNYNQQGLAIGLALSLIVLIAVIKLRKIHSKNE